MLEEVHPTCYAKMNTAHAVDISEIILYIISAIGFHATAFCDTLMSCVCNYD